MIVFDDSKPIRNDLTTNIYISISLPLTLDIALK